MPEKHYNVLFLCTGNSARSIIAEALMNVRGKGRFLAFSAGSRPTGKVNPFAIEIVSDLGLTVDGLRSKSWNEFAALDAPRLDFVFTVCDQAAGETCPHWPGQPMTAHWGVEDPAAIQGTDEIKRRAFAKTTLFLTRRIELFLSLPLASIDSLSLQSRIDEIGTIR